MNERLTHAFLSSGLVIVLIAFAQTQDIHIPNSGPTLDSQRGGMSQEPSLVLHGGAGKEMGFQFVAAEPAVSAQVVKGSPYSLEATVETEQTLADGNRIAHHQVVHVYRDSEGRTRREETLAAIGPWATSGTPPTIVTIHDPVAGVTYSLDPQRKIATRVPTGLPGQVAVSGRLRTAGPGIVVNALPEGGQSGPVTAFSAGSGVVMVQDGMASTMEKPDETSQSLGKETIAGVPADGVRLATTIPAEAMGNERPIEITRERWLSPDLQIVLRSKQSDPRFGVTTYEVTKLDRGNPPRSLFEIPRNYQVRKAPEPPPPPAPPK
jgi:hypothetical protein